MINEFVNNNPIIADIIFVVGVLASIFTIITFVRWIFKKKKILPFYLGPFRFITLQWYEYKAYKNQGNQEKAEYYLKYVYLNKLYSRNTCKQNIAIKEMVQLNDIEWAFLMFVERVGREPELSSGNKNLILEEIKKLCEKIKNSNNN